MKPALMMLAVFLAAPALAADPATAGAAAAAEIADPAQFAGALEGCTASTHAAPHPFVKGFTIEHRITGEADGACGYSQTMPGDMRMECRLSDAGRSGLAGEFREQAQGRMSGSTREQPAWTRECEIVGRDGKRTPMSGG
ncbi:MAG: hypothetical protein K0M70_00655 [Arenimonas sp.]|uniref:hypothetical protein n=1 Tax=Arenimonas sp. TaxID=1872635 RepID=UPI0025BF846B|nr:hypothetical protein [Arenimonas sp.]MBW8366358.1 hypothetical protein [Arenimonas sp.]